MVAPADEREVEEVKKIQRIEDTMG
jgi:hypothetical protein